MGHVPWTCWYRCLTVHTHQRSARLVGAGVGPEVSEDASLAHPSLLRGTVRQKPVTHTMLLWGRVAHTV